MNIACTACPARYGVADEKITGKRVRITCKRCGTVLVVDGTVSPPHVSASTSIAPGPAGRAASAAPPAVSVPPPSPPPEPFLVLFPDEHQERADVAQIVRFHRAGRLAPETLVWREGMDNWQSPWDVEEIASAFRRMGYARPTPVPASDMPRAETGEEEATRVAPSSPEASNPLFDDDESTNVVDTASLGLRRRARPSEPASSPVSEDDEQPTHVARASRLPARTGGGRASTTAQASRTDREQRGSARPAARVEPARRRESRRPSASPTAERFARQAVAGSEDEEFSRQPVEAAETARAQGLMDATDEGQRLTGARNETSVLFSLDSLLKKEQQKVAEPPRRQPAIEESLLVDTNSSLPVGGGFAPALSAPDFTAPITSPPPQFTAPATVEPVVYPRTDSSRRWMMMTAAVVLLSAVGFAWMSGALNPALSKVGLGPAPSAEPTPEPSSAPAASAEPAPTASTSADAQASASASASASAPAAPTSTPAPVAATPPPRAQSTSHAAAATPRAAPPSTGIVEEPEEAPAAPTAAAAPTTAPTPAAGGDAFDAGAAKTALTAAANNASSCKETGGATGNGRVSITFAPSGRPMSVAVTGDLAGTTVGSCVAKLFRQTRVPAFSGEPVTVAKSFSVQ